jgi:DUF4097 and DUF4098 domain-containing protein YvlB
VPVGYNRGPEEEVMKRTGFFLFAAALGVVVTGCLFLYVLEETETRTWLDAEGITEIAVTTENGSISVTSTADTTTTALITKSCSGVDKSDAKHYIDNVKITEDITGGKLSLAARIPSFNLRNYSADFEITTPESNYIDLDTTNGSVTITGMTGGAKIHSTNGRLTANDHTGSINALTVNGKVRCDISLLTDSDIVELETENGDMTLSLPAGVSASFNASTVNGTVTVTGFSPAYSTDLSSHKVGTIGPGPSFADITISSANGDVTIKKR